MLPEHLKPKQRVFYWSPTLNRHVLEIVDKLFKTQVRLSNGVQLAYKKIVCIQGAE